MIKKNKAAAFLSFKYLTSLAFKLAQELASLRKWDNWINQEVMSCHSFSLDLSHKGTGLHQGFAFHCIKDVTHAVLTPWKLILKYVQDSTTV